jgi:hypothetical protein
VTAIARNHEVAANLYSRGIDQFVNGNSLQFESFVSYTGQKCQGEACFFSVPGLNESGLTIMSIACGVPILRTSLEEFSAIFEGGPGARSAPPVDPATVSRATSDRISFPERLNALSEAMHGKLVNSSGSTDD